MALHGIFQIFSRNVQTNRRLEAEQSYKYAVKLGINDPDLLEEIRALQQTVGFGDPSF